jgi:hypothetical protein
MNRESKTPSVLVETVQTKSTPAERLQYAAPELYVIGRTNSLLQGSGRHKNDDTYRPGFLVDQH